MNSKKQLRLHFLALTEAGSQTALLHMPREVPLGQAAPARSRGSLSQRLLRTVCSSDTTTRFFRLVAATRCYRESGVIEEVAHGKILCDL